MSVHQPTMANTRVSGRRYLAHWFDSTIFVVLFLILVVLAGSLPDGGAADVLFVAALVVGFTVGQVAYYVLSGSATAGRTRT